MRVTIQELKEMKSRGEKIAVATAYDYTSARLLEEAGIPIMLVGDSLGQVVLGYDTTLPVTMDDMLHHARAVVRGTRTSHIVVDMPFLSYQADAAEAVRNAGLLLKEGGAQSVKLEGGRHMAETVRRLVQSGIPVMGHLGLTPQAINQIGRPRVQGKSSDDALHLFDDARALEEAGAYAIVVESVPSSLARLITERVTVPTIGIGAGVHCDGQVQVFHDMFGLLTDFVPRHSRRYANLAEVIKEGTTQYVADVRAGTFPAKDESFIMKQSVLDELKGELARLG